MKLLKLIKPFSVLLWSGRTDFDSIELNPTDNTVEYNLVVDENIKSKDYNKVLIDGYVKNGILSVLDVYPMGFVIEPFTTSDVLASYSLGGSWTAQWPVTTQLDTSNFTFTQSDFIAAGSTTADQCTVTATTITNGFIDLTVTIAPSTYAGILRYNCIININGTVKSAILTVEFSTLGS